MAKQYSLDLQQKQTQNLKQMQRLMMSPQMQQALHLLQMPLMELAAAINVELEANPVLEYSQDSASEEDKPEPEEVLDKPLDFDERDLEVLKHLDQDFQDHFAESGSFTGKRSRDDEKKQSYMESTIIAEESLFEHLMQQARDSFQTAEELALAEEIIGSLDENGYLRTSLNELSVLFNVEINRLKEVLEIIQTFDPYGVGAENLQEAMLIQMRCLGKQDTLAYRIVDENYDNLLHNRIPQIQKNLHCTLDEISEVIDRHISKLDMHPGAWYAHPVVQTIVPDLTIRQGEDDRLIVEIHDDSLPPLRLSGRYLKMLEDPELSSETKDFIKHKIVSAKWLMRNILQRNETLEKIGQALIAHQKEFLADPLGKLKPLTMKALAEELSVHESTIARAVNHKYIDTPRGVMPLRAFFTSSLEGREGDEVSSDSVREVIQQLIRDEDKLSPLSDEAIAKLIQAKGTQCARRTVAKYRGLLGLGNAQQRRKF